MRAIYYRSVLFLFCLAAFVLIEALSARAPAADSAPAAGAVGALEHRA